MTKTLKFKPFRTRAGVRLTAKSGKSFTLPRPGSTPHRKPEEEIKWAATRLKDHIRAGGRTLL